MSDQLTPPEPRFPRVTTRGAWIAAGVVLVLALTATIAWWPGSTLDRPSASPRSTTSAPGTAVASVRAGAIRALLASRARAILHRDRSALLATIDPTRSGFAAAQARMLTDLRRVPLASWSYTLGGRQVRGAARAGAGTVPTYRPVVSLHYRIRGFDTVATDLTQYPTFTRRGGRWYLASLDERSDRGHRSASELWDFGPVDVVRRPGVLVLGPPSMLRTMHQVAAGLRAAIPRVTSVWGDHWARRVVAEVPRSQAELASITGDTADVTRIAALTSAEISSTAGHPDPVGDRVAVNPRTWPSLDALGRRVVLTHELTHVASRADTGSRTPRWLQEGFADYVGFRRTGLAPAAVAAELARDVRAGRSPDRLPADRRFDGSAPQLAQAYQEGWLACRLIAARNGTRTLVRFYRQVGTSTAAPGPAVDRALHRLLHLSTRRFTSLWATYVRQQLA